MNSRTKGHIKEIAQAVKRAEQSHGSLGVTFRQGVVQSIDPGPPVTCGVDLGSSGVTIPGVRCLDSYHPVIGDLAQLAQWGPSLLLLGPIKTTLDAPDEQTLSEGYVEVFDGQSPPVRRARFGKQLDGKYGLRVWGSNGLLDYDLTT